MPNFNLIKILMIVQNRELLKIKKIRKFAKMSSGLIEKLGVERMASHAPLRRLGDSEDLKGLALLFASDAGKHITGQALAVDGGVSAIMGG